MILSGIAYAKLNLALHVRGKLADGRHRIETLFAFCEDGDLLTVEAADSLSLEIGSPFASDLPLTNDNLVLRAAESLRAEAGRTEGALIRLTKNLPIASGIGGGSADAAAALRLLTELWQVAPDTARKLAPKLGSDVPACLLSQSARGTGGGEVLEPVDLRLTGTPVLLVNPHVPTPTGPVFAAWDQVDRGALGNWETGRNDLEGPARELVPAIGEVLAWLRDRSGVSLARMSGSGATCFALFEDEEAMQAAAEAVPTEWWHLASRLR